MSPQLAERGMSIEIQLLWDLFAETPTYRGLSDTYAHRRVTNAKLLLEPS
jgi:hypothetical protein